MGRTLVSVLVLDFVLSDVRGSELIILGYRVQVPMGLSAKPTGLTGRSP